jgi:glutamate-1-semialdehyde 2,1-aminomutase
LILDPFPSRIGYARASDEFVSGLRRLCDDHGIVLIFDEVASFRVAWGGAQSHYDVKPDLTVFGKIIGGGLAVGAVGGTAAAMRIFDPAQKSYLSITGTFNANPLTMAAGLACLEDFTPEAVDRLNEEGAFLRHALSSEVQARGLPVEITGNASFVAAFFGKRQRTEYHSAAPGAEERKAISLYAEVAFRRGILIDTTGRLNLSTAFTRSDVEEASEILADSLEHVCNSDAGAFLKETT